MSQMTQGKNKALVLEAFDTLFNRRDYAAAQRFWSPGYIQHSAHIAPGREGLFDLVRSLPPTLKYEPGVMVADGDFVIVHGRFSGFGAPANWIAADILRVQDGILVEHWDVIQDEATQERQADVRRLVPCVPVSGLPWNGSTSSRGKPASARHWARAGGSARAGIPLGSRPVDLVATAGAASERHHVHPGTIQNRCPGRLPERRADDGGLVRARGAGERDRVQ
jgi:predicted SnoaL-like aldol condensation-catalyzing enzyme